MVPSRSPSPTLPPPGTILPHHFPSQVLPPPPAVYYGKSVTRVNDRILMKHDLPLSGDLHAFKNQLHQLDDYSPLVKANERLVRESNHRLQNFTDFICGSCAQLGHSSCRDNGFGALCKECDKGHCTCSKAMPLSTLLDSLEQMEAIAGLSTHSKSFSTYSLFETDKFLSSRNSSRPPQLPSPSPRGSVELLHHNGVRLLDTMSKLYQATGSQGLQFHFGNRPEFLGLFETLKSSMEKAFPSPYPLNPPVPRTVPEPTRTPTPEPVAGPSQLPEAIPRPAQKSKRGGRR